MLRHSIDRSGFGAVGTGIWGPPCWTRFRSPRHDRVRGSGTCEPKSRSPGRERSSGLPELRRSLRHGPAVCACALGETGPSQPGSNRHVTVAGSVRVYVIPLQLGFYLIFAGPAYEPRTVTGLHVTDQQPTTRAPHPTGAPPGPRHSESQARAELVAGPTRSALERLGSLR